MQALEHVGKLQFVDSFLKFKRLSVTLTRLQALVSTQERAAAATPSGKANAKDKTPLGRPDDLVRLYDLLLQYAAELTAIDLLHEDETLLAQLRARTKAFSVHRCFHLASAYQQDGQLASAAALFQRVQQHVTAARALYLPLLAAASPANGEVQAEATAVDAMAAAAAAAALVVRAQQSQPGLVLPGDAKTGDAADAFLSSRLDSFVAGQAHAKLNTLVELPPAFQVRLWR